MWVQEWLHLWNGNLYRWKEKRKSETEAISVAEQLLQYCKQRGGREPLQQENYNFWCNKSQQRLSTWFTWSQNLTKKGKSALERITSSCWSGKINEKTILTIHKSSMRNTNRKLLEHVKIPLNTVCYKHMKRIISNSILKMSVSCSEKVLV